MASSSDPEFDAFMLWLSTPDAPHPNTNITPDPSLDPTFSFPDLLLNNQSPLPELPDFNIDWSSVGITYEDNLPLVDSSFTDRDLYANLQMPLPIQDSHSQSTPSPLNLNGDLDTSMDPWLISPYSAQSTAFESSPIASSSTLSPAQPLKRSLPEPESPPQKAKRVRYDQVSINLRTPRAPTNFKCDCFPEGAKRPQRMDHHYRVCKSNPNREEYACTAVGCDKVFPNKFNRKRHEKDIHKIV